MVTKTYCVLMALTQKDLEQAAPRLKGGMTLREVSEKTTHTSLTSIIGEVRRRSRAAADDDSSADGGSFSKGASPGGLLKRAGSKGRISLVGVVKAASKRASGIGAAPAPEPATPAGDAAAEAPATPVTPVSDKPPRVGILRTASPAAASPAAAEAQVVHATQTSATSEAV